MPLPADESVPTPGDDVERSDAPSHPTTMPHDSTDSRVASQEGKVYFSEQTAKEGLFQVTATEIRTPWRVWQLADVASVECETKDTLFSRVVLKGITPATILITAVPVVLLFAKAFNLGGMKMDRGFPSLFLTIIAVMVVVYSFGVRWMVNRKRFFEHISIVVKNGTNQSFRSFNQVGRWRRIADAANQVIRERG